MERSEQVGDLMVAFAKAQLEFSAAVKDSNNPFYNSKYADLNAVIEAVRPALNKNGIALLHTLESDLERQCATTTVWLFHGEQFIALKAEAPAIAVKPVKDSAGKTVKDSTGKDVETTRFDVQTLGAAWTYLRRYTAQAICGLASEDDDGNSLQSTSAQPIPQKTKFVKELEASVKEEYKKTPPRTGFSIDGNIVTCTPIEVHSKETKGGKPYLFVMLDGDVEGRGTAYCYDTKFFDAIKGSKEHLSQFRYRVDNVKGYLYIEDVVSVAGEEYSQGIPASSATREPQPIDLVPF